MSQLGENTEVEDSSPQEYSAEVWNTVQTLLNKLHQQEKVTHTASVTRAELLTVHNDLENSPTKDKVCTRLFIDH